MRRSPQPRFCPPGRMTAELPQQIGRTRRVFAHTVPRCTPNWFAKAVTPTPLARAVRVAAASSSVTGVRRRFLGSGGASMSGSSGSPGGIAVAPEP